MTRIGLLRERKTPADTRVPLTPLQCRQIQRRYPEIEIVAEASPDRCFSDAEYQAAGIAIREDLSDCDILLGVKEVPPQYLIPDKTYCFFSHTRKKQPHNQTLMRALIEKRIRMIDYECLTHPDEQRIIGFGLFAGIVGAHNGLLTYGKKFGGYTLPPAHQAGSKKAMLAAYAEVVLPPVKIVVTGSGKVAAGVLDIMTALEIEYVEPQDFLIHEYEYPVYTHLKGNTLYARRDDGSFRRDDFHAHPEAYRCLFLPYAAQTDILMNGIYWDEHIDRLFEKQDVQRPDWRISVIADITCDVDGSVPINLAASTIAEPVYGVDRKTLERTAPFQPTRDIIDMMAVDNLPNELPADASEYFGIQLEKYVLRELLRPDSEIIARATICAEGKLREHFEYLSDYAYT
jgi:saccharopine dehydrogenase (NAD+, L-lysine-forming)